MKSKKIAKRYEYIDICIYEYIADNHIILICRRLVNGMDQNLKVTPDTICLIHTWAVRQGRKGLVG